MPEAHETQRKNEGKEQIPQNLPLNGEASPDKEARNELAIDVLETEDQTGNPDENKPTEYLGGETKDDETGEANESQQDESATLSKIQEEIRKLEKVENVRDLRTLDVDTLIELEDKFEGILLYAFTDAVGENTKIDFENWKSYKEPSQKTLLKVSFRGNSEAEIKVGAGDILPPSIQKITVYSGGDKNSARTSENRIGLKGRNQDGTGFFDNLGYIPIFSGDVIQIGGIDQDFDKKYRKENGQLDEPKYHAENAPKETIEQKAVQETFKTNPAAQKTKIMAPKEIDALSLQVESSEAGKRVIQSAIDRINSPEKNRSCWTVCEQIYQRAGFRRKEVWGHAPYTGKDCGNNYAGPTMIAKIETGDWLFINNKNKSSTHGNHSVIFVRWLDRENLIAEVASGGSNTHPRLHKANLKKDPVTSISKPIPA